MRLRVLHDLLIWSCHRECQAFRPGETATLSGSDVSCSQMHSVATSHQWLRQKLRHQKTIKMTAHPPRRCRVNLSSLEPSVGDEYSENSVGLCVPPHLITAFVTGFTVCQTSNQHFLNHILCKSSLVRCGTDQQIDFPISLCFNNLTLIHSFISVLNAAPLGHRLGIINNQIRSLIESRSRELN